MLLHVELTDRIIGAFFHVYDVLGYGFLESVDRRALAHELKKRGMGVECEVVVDVWYDSELVGHFKADMIVEKKVLVENKASERVVAADRKQLMNYLKATSIEVGLILHFGPRAGFQRVAYTNRAKPLVRASAFVLLLSAFVRAPAFDLHRRAAVKQFYRRGQATP